MRRLPGALVEIEGRRLADFSSNDYLGLATDTRTAKAAADVLEREGVGAGAARLISGTHPVHLALEQALAAFMRAPAALLLGSGYAANLGALPALVGPADLLYSDELNHASLIDGCRLSRATVRIFPHRDLSALDRRLGEDRHLPGARWIVVEGIYSMEGDLFPLDSHVETARAYGARIYLDDAHGVGVLGEGGRGTPELYGVEGEVDVVMGTLGKAFGAAGAFVAGSAALRESLLNRARPFVFSTAPPPAVAAAALAALEIVEAEPERRARLAANARRFRQGLAEVGRPVPTQGPGHITGLRVGDAGETLRIGRALETRGYLVGAVRPPSVPAETSRLRVGVSSEHTTGQLDGLLRALGELLPPTAG
jgi:8-amino-7-oxononanoate synthase